MNHNQFRFLYMIAMDDEKVECDKITHGTAWDDLTLNQQIKVTNILIGEPINFQGDAEDEIIFDSETTEYNMLDSMSEERWETYLEIMASRGITVTYDNVEDVFIISE